MALETRKADLFRKGEGAAFDRFLRGLSDKGPEHNARAEAVRLQPVLDAAATALAPHACTGSERRNVSATGLARIFRNNAAAYKTLIMNQPLIVEEGLLESRTAYGLYEGGLVDLKTALPDDSAVRMFEPKRYGNKQKRMFGTGYFGFLSIQRNVGRANAYSIVQSYVALPGDFLDIAQKAESRALTDEFARLSMLVNHDWFHSIMIGSINGDVSKPPVTAPAIRYLRHIYAYNLVINGGAPGTRRVADFMYERNLRTMDKLWPKGSTFFEEHDPYEEWPMRLQREVLTAMAEKPGNALAESVRRFRAAWDDFAARTTGQTAMETVKMTPAAYAMKLLAFNLVRAVPVDHPLVAAALAGTGEDMHAVFEKMYNSKMAKKTLFGQGIGHAMDEKGKDACANVGEYGAVVLEASAQGIDMAARDAREAFHYAHMRPVERAWVIETRRAGAVTPAIGI